MAISSFNAFILSSVNFKGGLEVNEFGPSLKAAFVFATHVLVAGALFTLLASMASGLYAATKYFQSRFGLPDYVVSGMHALENLVFIIDGICFSFLVIMAGWKFCVQIWADRRNPE